jgi:glycosyltransferase involved in cell wall biosynthesis
LGKVINGVNILARSHYYLLEALRMLGLESPSIMPELRLVVAGSLTDRDRRLIAERGMTNRVICKGNLDHLRTIGLLKVADLLFLPLHTVPAGKRATIVPGKTYEYLASGKPILAALPPGDAREMCMRAGNALMCDPDDAVGLARNIERAYRAWKNGSRMFSAQNNGHTRYERKRLAAQLATVVHGVASGRTTSPPISEQWNR